MNSSVIHFVDLGQLKAFSQHGVDPEYVPGPDKPGATEVF